MAAAQQAFAKAAREYVGWAERPPDANDLQEAFTARRLLAHLIATVIDLPWETEGADGPEITQAEWRVVHRRFGSLPFNYYSECFDPLVVPAEEPVVADLADDLADIWRDVKGGLLLYEAGQVRGAAWHWAFTYSSHWAHHATAALYAIQSWISKEGDDRS